MPQSYFNKKCFTRTMLATILVGHAGVRTVSEVKTDFVSKLIWVLTDQG